MTETDPASEDMTSGSDDEEPITRHREGEHVAGRPETVDESEVEAGEHDVGREGIDALPPEGEATPA